jgi:hypothetical protein
VRRSAVTNLAAEGHENIALGKSSMQSSRILNFSNKPGGARATSGVKTGGFGVHTRFEWTPWWIVDLLQIYRVEKVIVFNREDSGAERARSLSVSLAEDPAGPWVEVHRCHEPFGGYLSMSPLTVTLSSAIQARYVRLHLNEQNTLHVDEVEVYGAQVDASADFTPDPIYLSAAVNTTFVFSNNSARLWDEIWGARRNLELFCKRYGINAEDMLLCPTLFLQADDPFDGSIETLRLEPGGLWGNVFYAFLNGCMLARAMNCKSIELHKVHFQNPDSAITVDNIQIIPVTEQLSRGRTLALSCYWPRGFEPVLGHYSTEFALDTTKRFLGPIFSKYIAASGSLGAQTIVLHFRGGEIFAPGGTNLWYVQPPATYYICAIEYAFANLGVSAVQVVYQDKSNPAVDVVSEYLSDRGIPFSMQSASVLLDIATIMSAHHIVAAYGTFCEAISLLSSQIESYFCFRKISSQRLLSFWAQERLGDILNAKGVRTFVVDDPDETYIKRETWRNSPEQQDLIRQYPLQKLQLREDFRGINRAPGE